MFKRWGEKNSEALEELHPNLGYRNWDELSSHEKSTLWEILKDIFLSQTNPRVSCAIQQINHLHKYKSYGKYFLESPTRKNAIIDFEKIFKNESGNVVLELLSCFCTVILNETKGTRLQRFSDEAEESYNQRVTDHLYKDFDNFARILNDALEQFGINVLLTRQGFIPRQDDKITKEIYLPVLQSLSTQTWDPVNKNLRDAFNSFQEKTDQGYSRTVTLAVTALQAFLQIKAYGVANSSKGIKLTIQDAQQKNTIPNDKFCKQIFNNIEGILMRERGKTGDAHPKQEYATEKNARLILNLVMVFIQHCMQK